MNQPNRYKFIGWLAGGFSLAAIIWLRLANPSPRSQSFEPLSHEENVAQTIERTPVQSQPAVVSQPFAKTPYVGINDSRWAEFEARKRADSESEWRTPIVFYGKVVDEIFRPVSGAVVDLAWNGIPTMFGGDGVGKRVLQSDGNGLFTLTKVEGKCLTVRVTKNGYHVPPMANMSKFEYAGFWEPTFIEPDPNAPVVFTLVKELEAEPTYRIRDRYFLNPPELEGVLDLLSKRPFSSSTGDLSIKFTRPRDADYGKKMDWSIVIEGKNGAEIAATEDEFMQRAPLEGYQPSIVREYKADSGSSTGKFYVRNTSRSFFAAIEFEMDVYRKMRGTTPVVISVTATINPNNSPIVRYDPNKDIRKMTGR